MAAEIIRLEHHAERAALKKELHGQRIMNGKKVVLHCACWRWEDGPTGKVLVKRAGRCKVHAESISEPS